MLTLILKYLINDREERIVHLIACILPNVSSLIVLVCLIKLYHHYVKERFILKIGANSWRLIRLLFIAVNLNCSIVMNLVSFFLINYLRNYFDMTFIICTVTVSVISVLILVTIHSSNHMKINQKIKEGSLSIVVRSDSTREKTSILVPLDSYVLKSSKEQNVDKAQV